MKRLSWMAVFCVAVASAVMGIEPGQPPKPGEPPSVSSQPAAPAQAKLRVLFIGNSFTAVNNLTEMVRQLSQAAHAPGQLEVAAITPGGRTLQGHWEDKKALATINDQPWDFVVLQEQSQVPSFSARQRQQVFDPYVKKFAEAVRARKAKPVLFMTWGYRQGDAQNVGVSDSFAAMQQRLRVGCREAAKQCGMTVAPVGDAWELALKEKPNLDLWKGDGKHPGPKGTYLAACVFYRVLWGKSPVGISYSPGMNAAEARLLQEVAEKTVKTSP